MKAGLTADKDGDQDREMLSGSRGGERWMERREVRWIRREGREREGGGATRETSRGWGRGRPDQVL
jgi:hypothetical protein